MMDKILLYVWMFLLLAFALNLAGLGNDFSEEFKITWVLLCLIGWTISEANKK